MALVELIVEQVELVESSRTSRISITGRTVGTGVTSGTGETFGIAGTIRTREAGGVGVQFDKTVEQVEITNNFHTRTPGGTGGNSGAGETGGT